jgi:hypothetical protein
MMFMPIALGTGILAFSCLAIIVYNLLD